jgi:phosphatidylserine/phosphatidylglycerophosphate/cardiolipin synthase-like enzyme
MAEFLTTNKSLSAIEEIITQAKRELVLISPFVQIPEKLFRKLKDTTEKGVRLILVYGKKKELNPDVKGQLAELNNITVLYRETLHAKCFFNEEQMVITSMNLYDYSEKNDEMGILLSIHDDESLFQKARDEALSIVRSAEKIKIKDTTLEKFVKDTRPLADGFKVITDSFGLTTQEGFCIGCHSPIDFDTKRPLCKSCFPKWAKYRTRFVGGYCHKCGKHTKTTKSGPLCASCDSN